MKRHPSRPKNSVVQNPRGFRMHLQIEEANTLQNLLTEYLAAMTVHNKTTSERSAICSVTEVLVRLKKLTILPQRKDLNVQLTHAQFYALHYVLKYESWAENNWENLVVQTIFMSLDRLIA